MVASNPLFRGTWTAKKFQATVINDIWPETLFFSLVATMVVLVSKETTHKLGVANGLLTVLGTVLGLVISFRTSSAYERYQDGRKMWTNIMIASRNLAQQIWIHIPSDRAGKGDTTVMQNIIEKKSMINLITAFSVSVKHFLRGERGVYYEDLYPLISFLPKHAEGASPDSEPLPLWHDDDDDEHHRAIDMPVTELGREVSRSSSDGTQQGEMGEKGGDPEKGLGPRGERRLRPARNPPVDTIYDYFPLLRLFKWIARSISKRARAKQTAAEKARNKRRKHQSEVLESHIPVEIVLVLSNYTAYCMRNGLMQPAIATGVTANLTMLQDTVSNLERILNTPLPFAYQAHLRMSLWLYLFFLPFQIYSAFGWLTIPGTAFASFLLLGFLEIGQEIENPFNYDLNDLDLDYFCQAIQREMHLITAHPAPDPRSFIFTNLNQPFAPVDMRTAQELTQGDGEYRFPLDGQAEAGVPSLRRTLLKGWKEVDNMTRT
ncbi:UPF0187-domain-containing protein [Crepidotus variabilis]|uniref:UPF0187-domain-containing protein n=1 Tax=Crepidotus variabilis TaxID=179855 RepID=A0A9P6EA11_9AGAR|nr:UPF0187-domain-containing protein [Crepidotus variabilis]